MHDYLREVAISERADELDGSLFLGIRRGCAWTYCGVRKLLDHLNRCAGTSVRVTCYSYRRNAATLLFRKGLRIEDIAKQL